MTQQPVTQELRRPQLPPVGIASAEDQARLNRARDELVKDNQWIDDFIERLNCTIGEIGDKA